MRRRRIFIVAPLQHVFGPFASSTLVRILRRKHYYSSSAVYFFSRGAVASTLAFDLAYPQRHFRGVEIREGDRHDEDSPCTVVRDKLRSGPIISGEATRSADNDGIARRDARLWYPREISSSRGVKGGGVSRRRVRDFARASERASCRERESTDRIGAN